MDGMYFSLTPCDGLGKESVFVRELFYEIGTINADAVFYDSMLLTYQHALPDIAVFSHLLPDRRNYAPWGRAGSQSVKQGGSGV